MAKRIALAGLLIIAVLALSACQPEAAEPVAETLGKDLGEFSTLDFDGEEVTQEMLAENDVNMIFLWGVS